MGRPGRVAGKSFGLTIFVTDLTDDATVQTLEAALKDKGQDGLVSALGKIKDKGRVAPTGSVGTGFRFVRIRPTKDGGQHIVLLTDRPISFPELYNSTRSTDYKIGIVVLDVDKDGKGTGSFAPLCKVKFNKNNQLQIETTGEPFRLGNVFGEVTRAVRLAVFRRPPRPEFGARPAILLPSSTPISTPPLPPRSLRVNPALRPAQNVPPDCLCDRRGTW